MQRDVAHDIDIADGSPVQLATDSSQTAAPGVRVDNRGIDQTEVLYLRATGSTTEEATLLTVLDDDVEVSDFMSLSVETAKEGAVGPVEFMVVGIAPDGLHRDARHIDINVQDSHRLRLTAVNKVREPSETIIVGQVIDTLFVSIAFSLVCATIHAIAIFVVLMRLTMGIRSIVGVRDVAKWRAVASLFAHQIDHAMRVVEHGERILSECLIIDRSQRASVQVVAEFAAGSIQPIGSGVAVLQATLIGQQLVRGVAVDDTRAGRFAGKASALFVARIHIQFACGEAVSDSRQMQFAAQDTGACTAFVDDIRVDNTHILDGAVDGTTEEASFGGIPNNNIQVANNVAAAVELSVEAVLLATVNVCADRTEVDNLAHVNVVGQSEVEASVPAAVHLIRNPYQMVGSGAHILAFHQFRFLAIGLKIVTALEQFAGYLVCLVCREGSFQECIIDGRIISVLEVHDIIVRSDAANGIVNKFADSHHPDVSILRLVDVHECLAHAAYQVIGLLACCHLGSLSHFFIEFSPESFGEVGSSIVVAIVGEVICKDVRRYLHHILQLRGKSIASLVDAAVIEEACIAQERIVVFVVGTQVHHSQLQFAFRHIHQDAILEVSHAKSIAERGPAVGAPTHQVAICVIALAIVAGVRVLLLLRQQVGIWCVVVVVVAIGIDEGTIVVGACRLGSFDFRISADAHFIDARTQVFYRLVDVHLLVLGGDDVLLTSC